MEITNSHDFFALHLRCEQKHENSDVHKKELSKDYLLTVILPFLLADDLYSFFTSNRLLCMHTSVVKMIVCESVNLKSAG